jgi:hypothetical protein
LQSLGTMLVYLGFEVVPEKKNRTESNLANAEATRCPGNISLWIPSERPDVWAVAPSCWNHTLSAPYSSKKSSNLGRRKFSSIAQYRSEATFTVASSSSKKYGLHTPN